MCAEPILTMLHNLPFASGDLRYGGKSSPTEKLSEKVFASAVDTLAHGGKKESRTIFCSNISNKYHSTLLQLCSYGSNLVHRCKGMYLYQHPLQAPYRLCCLLCCRLLIPC